MSSPHLESHDKHNEAAAGGSGSGGESIGAVGLGGAFAIIVAGILCLL